jgi:RNA polymerase sigma factor (sigma-70 family)
MGEPSTPSGEPGLASVGTASRARRPGAGHPAAVQSGVEQDVGAVLADLYHAHYRSLCRLAALLTGDIRIAEAVVQDSFVALPRLGRCAPTGGAALPCLRRLVVARSRQAVRSHRRAGGEQLPAPGGMPDATGSQQQTPRFESSAVVLALRSLPASQREAVVLTVYLDLTHEQAAAAMRVSQTALRRYLAAARTALRTSLPGAPFETGLGQ